MVEVMPGDRDPNFDEFTQLPTYVDEPDPFLILGNFKLGLRELLSVITAILGWLMAGYTTAAILTFFSLGLALFLWSPFLLGGIALALVPWKGMTLERYIALKLKHMVSPKVYTLRDRNAKYGSIEDAEFKDLDDDF